jgi:hypothetical protein
MGSTTVGVIFVCFGAICAAVSSVLVHKEINHVNAKLSDEEQISLSFMYPGKMQKIKSEYKRLYPAGKIEAWRMALQIAGFGFLALAAIWLGFLKK